MENYSTASPLPFPVLSRVKDMLSKTLRETVTDVLMKKYHKDSEGFIYYEEILGLNDINIFGKRIGVTIGEVKANRCSICIVTLGL